MTSKTNIIEIDGKKYEVKEVDANTFPHLIYAKTKEQQSFISSIKREWCNHQSANSSDFNYWIDKHRLIDAWENYLINQARIKGFISGCTIKTATDMDIMKSGKLRLIGLSKLATEGRKSIVIYDNGRWLGEAIPCKSLWEMMCDGTLRQILNKPNTWDVGSLLTRDEMEEIKCEPEKYDIGEIKKIIVYLTKEINTGIGEYTIIDKKEVKLIREILNDYLK